MIAQYAKWILEQKVDATIDLHSAMSKHLAAARKSNPDFAMSGDGVHFDNAGHKFLAELIGEKLGLPTTQKPNEETIKRHAQRQKILRDAWLTHVGHKRPGIKPGLPLDEANAKAAKLLKQPN